MAKVDIAGLSYAELQELQRSVAEASAAKRGEALEAFRKAVIENAAAGGFDLKEALAPLLKKQKPVTKLPIKYSLDGKTWTGKGKAPSWFVDALKTGKSKESMLVASSGKK